MASPRLQADLRKRWQAGDALHVGHVIYELLDGPARVALAAKLLSSCCTAVPTIPTPIRDILLIAADPGRWPEAHDAFSHVRSLTLAHVPTNNDTRIYGALLYVAENAAKVIYNASGRPAPFDHDAGYWLVGCADTLTRACDSEDMAERLWSVLASSIASVETP
jgi:hypothetical protein